MIDTSIVHEWFLWVALVIVGLSLAGGIIYFALIVLAEEGVLAAIGRLIWRIRDWYGRRKDR